MEIFLVLIVVLALTAVWLYNRLVRARNTVSSAWADIDVQLQKRHELVPNLVATVKGYAAHEAQVLEGVTQTRSATPADLSAVNAEETGLSRQLGQLFALAEAYPELQADDNFRQLSSALVEIEEHIQFARRYYNGAVRDNNNLVESFPTLIIARAFGFRLASFFEIELSSQRQVPDVAL